MARKAYPAIKSLGSGQIYQELLTSVDPLLTWSLVPTLFFKKTKLILFLVFIPRIHGPLQPPAPSTLVRPVPLDAQNRQSSFATTD